MKNQSYMIMVQCGQNKEVHFYRNRSEMAFYRGLMLQDANKTIEYAGAVQVMRQ